MDVLHLQSFFSNKHISSQPHPRELLTLVESFIEDGECADSISAADIAVAYGISIDDEERKVSKSISQMYFFALSVLLNFLFCGV